MQRGREKSGALLDKGALKVDEFAQRPEIVASREHIDFAMLVHGLPAG